MGKSGRSQRLGILSEKERELIERANKREELLRERQTLQDKPEVTKQEQKRVRAINGELEEISRRLSVLVKKLDKRLDSLYIDLKLVLESDSLKSLRIVRSSKVKYLRPVVGLEDITDNWARLHEPIYEDTDGRVSIPDYSRWKAKIVHGNPRKYWLDINQEPEVTIEDVTKPEYAMRGIKGTWNKIELARYVIASKEKEFATKEVTRKIDVREILKKALEIEMDWSSLKEDSSPDPLGREKFHGVLPRSKELAIDIQEISKRIELFNKKRRKQEIEKQEEIRHLFGNSK